MIVHRLHPFILCICVHFLLSDSAPAQVRVGVSGPIPSADLDTMTIDFEFAEPAQRLDLLKRLGIDANIAEAAIQQGPSTGVAFMPLHPRSGKHLSLLAFPCGLQGRAFLYLLEQTGKESWKAVDNADADCFHQAPTYRLLHLSLKQDCLLVQHAGAGHGTGEVIDNAVFYTFASGRFKRALATADYIFRDNLDSGGSTSEQDSFFIQIAAQTIEETRVTAQNRIPQRADRRVWRWQPGSETFSATPFHAIAR